MCVILSLSRFWSSLWYGCQHGQTYTQPFLLTQNSAHCTHGFGFSRYLHIYRVSHRSLPVIYFHLRNLQARYGIIKLWYRVTCMTNETKESLLNLDTFNIHRGSNWESTQALIWMLASPSKLH